MALDALTPDACQALNLSPQPQIDKPAFVQPNTIKPPVINLQEAEKSVAVSQFRQLLITKHKSAIEQCPSIKDALEKAEIVAYPTSNLMVPSSIGTYMFSMNSLDGKNSLLIFEMNGELHFNSETSFTNPRNVLRLAP